MIHDTLKRAASEMRLEIPENQINAFVLFAEELKKWNRKINLTAIKTDPEIALKHIIDSMFLLQAINGSETLLDVGSGAGIPAIPIKIVRPDIHVTSVDSVGKKIQFQRHVARLLQLRYFKALHTRIEKLNSVHQGSFDIITSRAFSSLEQFVRQTGPHLANGGSLIAMKGPTAVTELEDARTVLKLLQFDISSVTDYKLPLGAGKRCLITIKRTKMPPDPEQSNKFFQPL